MMRPCYNQLNIRVETRVYREAYRRGPIEDEAHGLAMDLLEISGRVRLFQRMRNSIRGFCRGVSTPQGEDDEDDS